MPVPDDVIFGPWPDGSPCSYGDLRKMNGNDRITAFKRRLDLWLIAETNELLCDEQGLRKVYSPFPLVVMSCIAIETLGQVFYGAKNREAEGTQRDCFVAVAKMLDPKFSRPLAKVFKAQMAQRWPTKDLRDCNCIADIIYRFFRNSLMHSYRGYAVYITENDTASWMLGDGYIVLNPNWLWRALRSRYETLWTEVENAQENNPRRISCVGYLKSIVDEENNNLFQWFKGV